MGNVFTMSVNEMLFNALKTDDVDAFKRVYSDNNINANTFMSSSGRTLVHLCACYGSQQCLTYLLTQCNGNSNSIDINVKDQQDGSTPLILASKYNQRDIIEILLTSSNNCDISVTQCNDLNALDIAILRGNYDVAYYLKATCSFRAVKPLEEYKEVYERMNFPMFDLEKFYAALMKDTPPELTGKFEVCRDVRKEFEGKVPDPNETWGQFFRRIGKMELYQPPLVEETAVDEETKGRLYMKIQGMLCEMEYGVKMNTGKRKKRKENVSDGTSSSSNSNNSDVISVEHVEVKGNKQQQQQQTSCDGNSPKRQEHSMVESEDRFVKFEFKQNAFHN